MNSKEITRHEEVFKAAKLFGTPAYIYDMDLLEENIRLFNGLKDHGFFHLNYACKANSNINILKLMRDEGLGLDLVSPGEIELALHLNFDPKKQANIFF
jgi:diaminopimelate decarboxylase